MFWPVKSGKTRIWEWQLPGMLTSQIRLITLRYKKKIWNAQLMSVIIFYVLLATESESDISFAPSRLDFAAWEVTIFGKQ